MIAGKRQKIIGVIGGRQCSDSHYEMAETVGRLIAEGNGIVLCGGAGGIMEAACKGAVAGGGTSLGILPGKLLTDANPYVTIPIATGMGIGRNIIIAQTAQALIAVNGSYGTLSEIAFGLQLNRPVFTLQSWDDIPGVTTVASPEEAVQKAFKAVKNR